MIKAVGKNLVRKYLTWAVEIQIPKDVQHHFRHGSEKPERLRGRPMKKFSKHLDTDDLYLAELRKGRYLEIWMNLIKAARAKDKGEVFDVEEETKIAQQYFDAETALVGQEEAAKRLAKNYNPVDSDISQAEKNRRLEIYGRATRIYTPTADYVKEWADQHGYVASVRDGAVSFLLNNFCKRFPYFEIIEVSELKIWVDDLLQGRKGYSKWTRRTVNKNFGYANKLWKYCEEKYTAAPNLAVSAKILPKETKTKANRVDRTNRSYIRFNVQDCFKLHDAAVEKGDDRLGDIIKLGMYTGCRLGELCHMKLTSVEIDRFTIINSKSEAGVRDIPIHKDIQQLVARLKQTSTDGFLISGLSDNNKYKDRSKGMSHKFNRLKHSLGFMLKRQCFHSFRSTLANRFENAGVPENFAARIIGHELGSDKTTYDLYSGGIDFETAVEAMTKVEYKRAA